MCLALFFVSDIFRRIYRILYFLRILVILGIV